MGFEKLTVPDAGVLEARIAFQSAHHGLDVTIRNVDDALTARSAPASPRSRWAGRADPLAARHLRRHAGRRNAWPHPLALL